MSELKRSLNLFDTIMFVSGSMIGSGIFIVSAEMTRLLVSPYWVLACWVVSGLITLFAALSYGELAGMMPEAGGQFIYLKRAFGHRTAFVYGWTVFLVIQTGVIAAVAVAFAKYAAVFFPAFNETNILFSWGSFHLSATSLLAIISILFLTWMNTLGIRSGKLVQRTFTTAKILAIVILILVAFFACPKSFWMDNFTSVNLQPSFSFGTFSIMGVAMIGSLFSMDAWNNVTFISGEIREPKRNIPLGLLFGVLIVTLLYLLANVAYFILLPAYGDPNGATVYSRGIAFVENNRVGTAAMFPVFGNVSVFIMAFLIVISTFGCNNGLILQGARLYKSMADDGLFFRAAGKLNNFDVPSSALWFQAIWSSLLCLSGSYGNLLDYCTFSSLLFYIITVTGLFVLRVKEPNAARPYKCVGYPLIPGLYVLLASAICIDLLFLKPDNALWGLAIMLTGIPVYYLFTMKRDRPRMR
jgi:APA family basic amino acid/polyamine antiporter